MKIVVVVPAFNEERNLPQVLSELREFASQCEVVVVDDGSSDGTAAIAVANGVRVLRCPVNLGIGGAVQLGYLWARDHGFDVAVQIDGDGQHAPSALRSLLARLETGEVDLVIGSRFLSANEGFQSTLVRRAGIRYLSWLLSLRFGARVTDPTSGYRAASRRAIELFARHYPTDYPEPESIALAISHGLEVCEVPVVMKSRAHGRSSIDAWKTIYYLIKVSFALAVLPSDRRLPSSCQTP